MLNDTLNQLYIKSRFVQTAAATFNALPFPYHRLMVKVGKYRMGAHTLDRFMMLWLWRFGLQEATEVRLLSQLCRPGMTALDIGANIGYYSLMLAQWVGQKGHVWAFEPDPANFASLQRNLRQNHCSNVTAVNFAVSHKTEKQFLYISQAHSGDHRVYLPQNSKRIAIPVDTVALDDFLDAEPHIELIKMDIQGAEGLALSGMSRILHTMPRPILFMEFWPDGLREAGSNPEQVLLELQEMGFELAWIDDQRKISRPIISVNEFVDALDNGKYVNILAR